MTWADAALWLTSILGDACRVGHTCQWNLDEHFKIVVDPVDNSVHLWCSRFGVAKLWKRAYLVKNLDSLWPSMTGIDRFYGQTQEITFDQWISRVLDAVWNPLGR